MYILILLYYFPAVGKKSADLEEFMKKNYKPGFAYHEFGPQFTAEFFDPAQWADIIKKSGAK